MNVNVKREVIRIRSDTWYDYVGIVKSFVWDDPVEVDDCLYLGNVSHCFFLNTLQKKQIRAVVNVTSQIPNYYQEEHPIEYFTIPIDDLNDVNIDFFLEASYRFINRFVGNGENVLVHCIFGRSRSVAVCLYYLMKRYGHTLDRAYEIIRSKKPIVNVNQSFVDQIKTALQVSPSDNPPLQSGAGPDTLPGAGADTLPGARADTLPGAGTDTLPGAGPVAIASSHVNGEEHPGQEDQQTEFPYVVQRPDEGDRLDQHVVPNVPADHQEKEDDRKGEECGDQESQEHRSQGLVAQLLRLEPLVGSSAHAAIDQFVDAVERKHSI